MHQNRIGKYLFYASGEIILVMIGILLALQVNNWNEERKNARELRIAFQNLNTEIQQNVAYLDGQIERLDSDLENVEYFIWALNTREFSTVPDSLITQLIAKVGPFVFTPLRENSYRNLIDSGIINFVQDDSLKRDIIGIERGYQLFAREREKMEYNWNTEVKPYYLKHAPIMTFVDSLHKKPIPDTYYSMDRERFINNLELTNILTVRIFSDNGALGTFKGIRMRLADYNERIETYLANH